MSYLVLARKYRSRNFSELVGQEHVVQALGNALQTGRLHHAYLFTGTRGVGKTTVSRILAKALNCVGVDGKGGITAEPCGVCDACRDIDAGRFVDYTELDAASNRGVDEVQSLLEQAVYKPVQGRFKVFMIDEVHMLTGHAFNAMLKTLEEPPEYLKFVLATTDPQKVPVTVLSRCLQFNLRPMAPDTIERHLVSVLGTEGIPADAGALRQIARAARGSMRDALSLTDQAIAFGNGSVADESVRQMLGGVDQSHVLRLVDALAVGDGRAVVETVDVLRTHGVSAAATLEDMAALLQRMAVMQVVPQMAAATNADDAEAVEAARLAVVMPPDETQLLYSLCLHGRTELGLAPDEYSALTMVLLRLLAFKPKTPAGAAALAPEKKSLNTALTRPADTAAIAKPPEQAARPSLLEGQAHAKAQAIAATGREAEAVDLVPPHPAAVPSPSAIAPAIGMPAEGVVEQAAATATPPPAAEAKAKVPSQTGPAVARTAEPPFVPPWEDPPVTSDAGFEVDEYKERAHVASAQAARKLIATPPGLPVQEAVAVFSQPPPAPLAAGLDAKTEANAIRGSYQSNAHDDHWHATVSALITAEAIGALVRELALQSQLISREGAHWTIRVERESLNQSGTRERLRVALHTAGHAEQLTVELGAVLDSPAMRNISASQARQLKAEEVLRNDAYVQMLVRDFGAKIVPGSWRVTPVVTSGTLPSVVGS